MVHTVLCVPFKCYIKIQSGISFKELKHKSPFLALVSYHEEFAKLSGRLLNYGSSSSSWCMEKINVLLICPVSEISALSLSLSVHRETDWQEQQMYAELPSVHSGWWITKCWGWWDAWFELGLQNPEGIWCTEIAVRSTLVLDHSILQMFARSFSLFSKVCWFGDSQLESWRTAFLEEDSLSEICVCSACRERSRSWVQAPALGEDARSSGLKKFRQMGHLVPLWAPWGVQGQGLLCTAAFLLGLCPLSAPDQTAWLCAATCIWEGVMELG